MRFLRDQPIGRKLTIVILVIASAALLVTGGALFGFQLITFRQGFTRDLSALGRIIASHSAAPLTFKDNGAATEMLAALKAKPHIVQAELRLKEGTQFATYGKQLEWERLDTQKAGILSFGRYLIYAEPVMMDGEQLGVLLIRSDYYSEFYSLLRLYAGILGLVLTLAIVLTFFLGAKLQRVITHPILALAQTAKLIAGNRDYSVRVRKLESDEIGDFTDAFNRMLEQIQERDTALHQSQQKFETLVNSIEGVVWEANPLTLEFSFVSRQAQKLLGIPPHLWLGKTGFWQEHVHVDDREHFLRTLRGAVDEKSGCAVEFRMMDAQKNVIWVRAYNTVVLEKDSPVLLRGVLLDITREKQAAEELAALHQELVQTSRQAGMAEVATGVLHNVGNVLNSINVSSTLVCDRVRKSEVTTLKKVAGLFREHETDLPEFIKSHPKGRMLPGFVQSLSDELGKERDQVLVELELLAKNIDHIKEIVAMQQSYAKVSGVMESIPVPELIEDALQINAAGFKRHGVQIVQELQPVPPVMVDKHKVLQILINLFSNAKYAMDEVKTEDKRLLIGVRATDEQTVLISVKDNGIGIPPENLTRIFGHGFTTKRDGHGFGLHSGALAAKEMGGALSAHSDGIGKGATFILELPITTPRKDS